MAKEYFADLHIHVGITESGSWIKIPSSRHLTAREILAHAAEKKGLDIVGLVDAMSPAVLADLQKMLGEGFLTLNAKGAYRYQGEREITLLLGAEIETREENGSLAHTLIYLSDMESMAAFSQEMSKHIKNINLSSQNARMPLKKLIALARPFEPLIIPAHVFTPHKSIYGSCARRLTELLPPSELKLIGAIELGLSADSFLADRIEELAEFSFLTNSDAHSPEKIGREYNKLSLASEANFTEVARALARKEAVLANYGLNPRLVKYHRTVCSNCGQVIYPDGKTCPFCKKSQMVKGVLDRINEIADYPAPKHPEHRPPYFYQTPLEFIPGLGKKTLAKLMARFKTEMNIMHFVSVHDLEKEAGAKIAASIITARSGKSQIVDGGGGIYGKIVSGPH